MSKRQKSSNPSDSQANRRSAATAASREGHNATIRTSSNRLFLWFLFLGSILGSMVVMALSRMPPSQAPELTYEIVNTFPHDDNAFTQGLVFDNDQLYEGTGRLGQSTLRLVEIPTGEPLITRKLPDHYFGEGITVYGSKIYQLTFQNRKILIYDKESLKLLEEKDFPYDGWGLTSDSDYLIHSDGTSTIRFLDPETFEVASKITVRDGQRKISEINELEYYDGRIYANVWHENFILQIVPATGRVSARIDLSGLLDIPLDDSEACLNGIAVNDLTNTFYVTGKLWPKLFEVRFVEKESAAKPGQPGS